jgi:retinoblastoma-like protein 1
MYNSLIVARPALSAEINRLGLLAEPMPSLDAIVVHHDISVGGLPPLPFQKQELLQGKSFTKPPSTYACFIIIF